MILELLFRFLVGGLVVCAFAVIGEVFKPQSFGGIFGAAPSVALATLGLTLFTHGGAYTSLEGRSMVIGAAALLSYSLTACWLVKTRKMTALPAASMSMVVWVIVAFGLWAALLA